MLDANLLAAIAEEARQAFLEEDAPECLEALNVGLQELERVLSSNPNSEQRFGIYKNLGRAAHSLKGGAGMAALPTLSHLCHRMEDLFESLEEGKIKETATALELLVISAQEVQNRIDLAIAGQNDDGQAIPLEIAVALEEFLTSFQTVAEETVQTGEISGFIRTALSLELEACLERVETALGKKDPAQLQERFHILSEECTLLGQALSCPWLEDIITVSQTLLSQGQSLESLLPPVIAEIRYQREQFLEGGTPQPSPAFQSLLPETQSEVVVVAPQPTPTNGVEEVPAEIPLKTVPTSHPEIVPLKVPVASKVPQSEPKAGRQNLRIPLERLTRMSNTVSELLINHERLLIYDKQLRQASRSLKQRSQQLVPMREQVESLYDELTFSEQVYTNGVNGSELEILAPQQNFDALEFDRYSSVHTILQRFQELMVQVQEIQEDVDIVERDLQETLIEVRQSLNALDTDLTESRLLPFGNLAKSFIQPLEKLSEHHRKPAKVMIEGETILVEVSILEQLRTPLTHLIRNAFDHGLETPQERRSQGKDTQGKITLKAETDSSQVVITVTDDGKGVNLAKIRQKALDLGILSDKDAQSNQPDKILDCLFAPGFSTATQVSDLSGRGLGLDIVKHLVESLRGSIKLETEAGKGSRFTIRIPLSLNILPLLLVRSQERVLAFPSQSILRILPLKDATIVNHHLEWEGRKLPIRNLDELLPYHQNMGTVSRSMPSNPVGLMVTVNGQNRVVTVEQVLDERPLVVKALDPITPLPPYVAGCTVLGTGEVVAIFAPENFERLWEPFLNSEKVTFTGEEARETPKTKLTQKPAILIVDDSITVRRTLDRVLSRSGYDIIQCRDGKEAWDLLNRQKEAIALTISDLEMPNMDGFTLLQLIRGHETWGTLPVMVLTSRENDLHRQRAMDLGANDYLTKPFQPNQLLEAVSRFMV